MPAKKIKVVIDTNIWVSFLIGQTLSNLEYALNTDVIQIVVSHDLIKEMTKVLHRPKFKPYFSAETINEFISLVLSQFELIEIHERVNICRDPKDNFLLDLCLSGQADYLITGDSDLLELHPFNC